MSFFSFLKDIPRIFDITGSLKKDYEILTDEEAMRRDWEEVGKSIDEVISGKDIKK